ncbi:MULTISPECIES: tRNA dihydrouridine synthase DusB [unclassified Chelatococcus]|uniref:tRNA dihydrouridine synthase DusB n=1 Tax=unclassified Chelatococcus TaxID=2638111 RepID=UPI0020BEE466|nr:MULTISPECIES: tRNA dihydrouridine synthase DusB [unclassified Chelatococcus]
MGTDTDISQWRPTLALGAVLAPMSGITDVAFRRIAHRFGASLVVSEMVASQELVDGSQEAVLRAEGAGITPHVVQLAGCDAHWMGEAARVAEASGAAMIDINMGCPAKRVIGGWAGSALMRDLDHATSLIEAVVAAVKIPVSVKMRLGWDDGSQNADELARRAEISGAVLITVHGRTRQQFYKGTANWGAVRRVREVTTLPLVVNGDIADVSDARAALDQAGADAVMIGRAAVGQPWLVGQIAAELRGGKVTPLPSPALKTEAITEHYTALLTLYGKKIGLRHARKHLAAYCADAERHGSATAASCRAELVTSEQPERVLALLQGLYEGSLASPVHREAA